MARTRFLVSYDVTNDKRRGKVHRALQNHGDWLQYSLFQCDLNPRELVALRTTLHVLVHHTEDQVLFIDLGPAEGTSVARVDALGRPYTAMVRSRVV
ncbi:MAG: CRISPR-associated endonuclease Cas2 [Myxococcales bacterium]|nr:CRISPR-associated endonuclease Cas2 [Myxococcales bacterium]